MTPKEQFENEYPEETITFYTDTRWRYNPKYVEWLESEYVELREREAWGAARERKEAVGLAIMEADDNGFVEKYETYEDWKGETK